MLLCTVQRQTKAPKFTHWIINEGSVVWTHQWLFYRALICQEPNRGQSEILLKSLVLKNNRNKISFNCSIKSEIRKIYNLLGKIYEYFSAVNKE